MLYKYFNERTLGRWGKGQDTFWISTKSPHKPKQSNEDSKIKDSQATSTTKLGDRAPNISSGNKPLATMRQASTSVWEEVQEGMRASDSRRTERKGPQSTADAPCTEQGSDWEQQQKLGGSWTQFHL